MTVHTARRFYPILPASADAMLAECVVQLRALSARLSPLVDPHIDFIFAPDYGQAMIHLTWDQAESCLTLEVKDALLTLETIHFSHKLKKRWTGSRVFASAEGAMEDIVSSLMIFLTCIEENHQRDRERHSAQVFTLPQREEMAQPSVASA